VKAVTQPNVIEQTDFLLGWAPSGQAAAEGPTVLLDVLNLLPDKGGSGALEVRDGFRRIRQELVGDGTHYILNLFPFRAEFGGSVHVYLIAVVTNGTAGADNVQVYAIDLADFSKARIDTPGRTWAQPTKNHWGVGVQNIYYGGSPGNNVYSWDPSTSTWNATANVGNWKTVVDAIDGAVDLATQWPRDFAFKGNEKVFYNSGKVYTPVEGIRYDTWNSGDHYEKGDKVSSKAGLLYWKSFKCIKAHNADATNQPGVGANTATYWQKVRLPLPTNDSGETSDKWYFVPVAPGSSVAAWHADRMWIRYDNEGDKSRLLFSAPLHYEKDADVPDVKFSMTDFAPGNDMKGPGGGWLSFNDGRHHGVITALRSYGQYLLVFKKAAVWALSGYSEDTFNPRRLTTGTGCVGPFAHCEFAGLVYFLGPDGLYVTDGTAVEPVTNYEATAKALEARLDEMGASGDARSAFIWSWEKRIWIALCDDAAAEKWWTLVYDPATGGWWKTDLPVLSVAKVATGDGTGQKVFFSAPTTYSTRDLIYQYEHPSANNQDDTGANVYATRDIPWKLRTAWWPFGVLREQRRIRRVWALVKGAMTYTLKAYRNWSDTPVKTTTRVVSTPDPQHIEGEWFADSHAVSFELSSTKRPAVVYGIAVDSEPRHIRYHA
jgi:hypothetical protein